MCDSKKRLLSGAFFLFIFLTKVEPVKEPQY